jgi:hypothetical protein
MFRVLQLVDGEAVGGIYWSDVPHIGGACAGTGSIANEGLGVWFCPVSCIYILVLHRNEVLEHAPAACLHCLAEITL